jgi:hypothetical protein
MFLQLPLCATRVSIQTPMLLIRNRFWLVWPELNTEICVYNVCFAETIVPIYSYETLGQHNPPALPTVSHGIHHQELHQYQLHPSRLKAPVHTCLFGTGLRWH